MTATDICFPKDNEEAFISMANSLNTNAIVFVYHFKKEKLKSNIKRIESLKDKNKIRIFFGLIVKEKDAHKARDIADIILIESSEKDQHILEKCKPDIIFNLENSEKKDKTHYRYSNLNQVLCKLCNKNKTIIGISFSNLLKNKDQPKTMGRISQNIMISEKYGVPTPICSFAYSPEEMRQLKDYSAFLRSLGASTDQSKKSESSVYKKIKENAHKKSEKFISEEVNII